MSSTTSTRLQSLVPRVRLVQILTILVTAAVGTMLIITVVPLVNTLRVQAGLDRAADQLESDAIEDARQSLHAVQPNVFASPPLAARFCVLAIRTLARGRDINTARHIAEWMRTTTDTRSGISYFGGTRPGGFLRRLKEGGENIVVRLSMRSNRQPFEWDHWQGYQALLDELARMGDHHASGEVTAELARIVPGNPLVVRPSAPASRAPSVSQRRPRRRSAPTSVTTPRKSPQATRADSAWIARVQAVDKQLEKNPTDESLRRERDDILRHAGSTWGVVNADVAHAYDISAAREQQVKRRGVLRRDTVLDINEYHAAGPDTLAFGRFESDGATRHVAVRIRDLSLFPGSLNATPEPVRKLLVDRQRLKVQLQKLKNDSFRDQIALSSEGRAYLRARKERKAFYARMKILLEKVNADTVEMSTRDELRKMKYAQSSIDQSFESARAVFQRWKSSRETTPDNPTTRTLKQKLNTIETRLDDLAAREQ